MTNVTNPETVIKGIDFTEDGHVLREFKNVKDASGEYVEEEYLFEDCVFQNCHIFLITPYATFVNCRFEGEVHIHNQGVGSYDTVEIKRLQQSATPLNLSVSSTSVMASDTRIAVEKLKLMGFEVELADVAINGTTLIQFYGNMKMVSTTLDQVNFNNPTGDGNAEVSVENCLINGKEVKHAKQLIELLESDINPELGSHSR